MRGTAKRVLLGAAVVAVTTLVGPAAHATADTIDGGCFVVAINLNSMTNFVTAGFLIDASATRNGTTNPVMATVTCWIEVNGVSVPDSRFASSGYGAQAGLHGVAFDLHETDTVLVCQQVDYEDGASTVDCEPAPTELNVPPQQALDAIHGALDEDVNPVVCPLLAAHAGTYANTVVIAPSGDVTVQDPSSVAPALTYDCPPYGPPLAPAMVVVGPVRT